MDITKINNLILLFLISFLFISNCQTITLSYAEEINPVRDRSSLDGRLLAQGLLNKGKVSIADSSQNINETEHISNGVKSADLAGSWYPSSEKELSQMLEGFLSLVPRQEIDGDIIALIQPHAGIKYSGPVAAYGFNLIRNSGIKTVIIVGFTHRKYFEGVSVYSGGAFSTPLGKVKINKNFAEQLIAQDALIKFNPQAFIDENSIELQLPFLKKILPDVLIVPVAIGDSSFSSVNALSKALYNLLKGKKGFLMIASTDLSHYLPYGAAMDKDRRTLDILKKMNGAQLFKQGRMFGSNMMCGVSAVAAVILAADKLSADNAKILKYANSGDTAGDKSSVVGYVSAVIYRNKAEKEKSRRQNNGGSGISKNVKAERMNSMLTQEEKERLLRVARDAIGEYLKTGKIKDFKEDDPELLEEKGVFVTLRKSGRLRGCIGSIIGREPLYKTVRDMSIESAVRDPRFSPIVLDELKDVEIEISVLSKTESEFNPENIIMGKHGVIVKSGYASGVFLPQVADETGWSREEFLSNLCAHKAGLPQDAWKDNNVELYTFTAEVFSEKDVAARH